MLSLGAEKKPMTTHVTGLNHQWAGLDSNQRRLTPMGLQPIPFSHSGTDPDEKTDFTNLSIEFNKKMVFFTKNGFFLQEFWAND